MASLPRAILSLAFILSTCVVSQQQSTTMSSAPTSALLVGVFTSMAHSGPPQTSVVSLSTTNGDIEEIKHMCACETPRIAVYDPSRQALFSIFHYLDINRLDIYSHSNMSAVTTVTGTNMVLGAAMQADHNTMVLLGISSDFTQIQFLGLDMETFTTKSLFTIQTSASLSTVSYYDPITSTYYMLLEQVFPKNNTVVT
eukprot:TRINITY_DN22237_c0_g1_i1.p1 TRINITY_DN22237_c0_g1~~TRINITY_DN22237_c0_g1_i1.p1  ORF type:complete len:198 (+),score=26.41 TRINITY_DN22237_c0_g1_i1:47-640(+)